MTKTLRVGCLFAAVLAFAACKKKDDAAAGKSGGAAAAKSGLAWTPDGYEKMGSSCKKALACCEDMAKTEGAKSPEDYNGKCSGPSTWKEDECDTDVKGRVAMLSGKTVPDACK